jgi:hypothetical protein
MQKHATELSTITEIGFSKEKKERRYRFSYLSISYLGYYALKWQIIRILSRDEWSLRLRNRLRGWLRNWLLLICWLLWCRAVCRLLWCRAISRLRITTLLWLRITTLLRTLRATTKELHIIGNNLSSIVLNAIALPLTATKATLDIYLRALAYILVNDLCQAAP